MIRRAPALPRMLAAFAAAGLTFAALPARTEPGSDYAAYLAGECLGCHLGRGHAGGIPRISGLPEGDFPAALRAYRSGERAHPVMHAIAARLSDADIAALTAYFASSAAREEEP